MNKIQEKNDVFKEVLTILAYFNDELIEKIPAKVLKRLKELSADSKANFYINTEKKLEEQDISEESKDLIALIYYSYIADENEKNELLKLWNENENKYQEKLREKYNPDNIFKDKQKPTEYLETPKENTEVAIYKESFLSKIISKIKLFFHK